MVHKIDFEYKYNKLKEFLINRKALYMPVLDPEVMTELGFSPPSWKTWKPQMLTMSQKPMEIHRNDEGQVTDLYYIRYNKKSKEWTIEHIKSFPDE